ncbi:hypothetical protein APS56_03365 [Pseudalgibacter alginicilyticus]|uniref:Secretion system C-terminal sorting domain-containing protein n=1 Tax=Pseudalgibacter alginicilyticus TaxID=1736674 RepID=A0A0P0DEZ6_9FLAO|nr:hypothetical protein APS56_03365 [Pseudalgibacter alginicilyticus]
MKKMVLYIIGLLSVSSGSFAQVYLKADGPGTTYEEINAVLAPGYNAIESPDCSHLDFGRHIDEIFDTTLNDNVFRFFIHLSPDNNKCVNADRQRNEIKTYDQSPANLKGVIGETVEYKWKFKLDTNFLSSGDFTHIHQLKSVGADAAEEAQPLMTLTTRYKTSWGSTPHRIELIHAPFSSASSLLNTDISPFLGEWVEVTETVLYGDGTSGAYTIVIKRLSDKLTLMEYSNSAIRTWKTNANFIRPKWGIYRKNNHSPAILRDEAVLFADFSIIEGVTLGINNETTENVLLYPNPAKNIIIIKAFQPIANVIVFSMLGERLYLPKVVNESIDVSTWSSGMYLMTIKTINGLKFTKKIIIQ